MSEQRVSTDRGRLARLGFQDLERAGACYEELGPVADELLHVLAGTADPDAALCHLTDLASRFDDPEAFIAEVAEDEGTAMRLLSVLGASDALAQHLKRHPDQWMELADPTLGSTRPPLFVLRNAMLAAVGADVDEAEPVSTLPDEQAVDAIRVEYRRWLLRLVARDLAHGLGVDDVGAELADLAAGTLEAALAIARTRSGSAGEAARLAVIAMGKCGGRELNYVSDVDVIFAVEPKEGHDETAAVRGGTLLASNIIKICSDHTGEGTLWPVDAALRPEGKAGPLVRTLASHLSYYERWASTWEFQALLKARPVAGDHDVGRQYIELISPMVWTACERENFVTDVQTMRRRVLEHIPASQAARQIKLGAGGLRDVEFAVQLLQLVHGRDDDSLRERATLSALARLTRGGYVGRSEGARLDQAYRFLRALEHRLQLHRLRRTHVLPDDQAGLRRLGRAMGLLRNPVEELDKEWQEHSREVRRLHEKLFYRPLLEAVARIPSDEVRLSPEAAKERLTALGYLDAGAALRHLQALTDGVSRTASIQRTLLPAMLGWFAEAPNPDAGLQGFRQISDALGATPWYLRLLRDEGLVAQRMAQTLASSRYATDLMMRAPEAVAMFGDDAQFDAQPRKALETEMVSSAARHEDPVEAVRVVRGIRRRELFRLATGELLGLIDVDEVGEGLTAVTAATLEAALEVAMRAIARERRGELPMRMAIVSMGRFGGGELSYSSDADVMFVFDPLSGADLSEATRAAQDVAQELRRLLMLPGTDPELEVDADLRPEGRKGALVRSLDSYAAYYARWSEVWEAQALLRADAVIGDPALCRAFIDLIDPLRFPEEGISAADIREVRRIKARVDTERLPRGADPATHLKLGRGGLADIEWTIQLLQMRYAGKHAQLRTPRTLEAVQGAVAEGLMRPEDAEVLTLAWRSASRIRNATVQVRGKSADSLPRDARERAAVAHVLGYGPGSSDEMVNDHLRLTRHASAVVDRLFWEE